MVVTQEHIAKKVGLDRSTVSKILNGRASNFVSPKTIGRVISAAKELGYDFGRLRHTHSRQFERADLTIKCDFDIMLEGGKVFDSGTAVITNISEGSALLENVDTEQMVLPLEPFTISIIIKEGMLKNVSVLAHVTRLQVDEGLKLGTEFIEVSPVSAKKLKRFMEKNTTKVSKD